MRMCPSMALSKHARCARKVCCKIKKLYLSKGSTFCRSWMQGGRFSQDWPRRADKQRMKPAEVEHKTPQTQILKCTAHSSSESLLEQNHSKKSFNRVNELVQQIATQMSPPIAHKIASQIASNFVVKKNIGKKFGQGSKNSGNRTKNSGRGSKNSGNG